MKRHFYSVKRWLSMVSCAALTAGLVSVASFPATQAEAAQRAAATVHDVNLSLGEWDQVTDNFESWYSDQISPYKVSYKPKEELAQKSVGDLWEIKTDEDGSNPRLHRKENGNNDSFNDAIDGWWIGNRHVAVLNYKKATYTNFELEVECRRAKGWQYDYYWPMVGFRLTPRRRKQETP